MANWMGGSAPAMAGQVEGGFILLSSNNLKGFLPPDLQLLRAELEKALRTARSEVPTQDDATAQQARSRRITRISGALQVVQNQLSVRR
jgi:hypothetical protein